MHTFQINVLILFLASSTCFEHHVFIIRKTICVRAVLHRMVFMHLYKYEGKSLNNRNYILKCMEKYAHEKSYFRTQNGSLAICHIEVVMIKQFEPAQ